MRCYTSIALVAISSLGFAQKGPHQELYQSWPSFLEALTGLKPGDPNVNSNSKLSLMAGNLSEVLQGTQIDKFDWRKDGVINKRYLITKDLLDKKNAGCVLTTDQDKNAPFAVICTDLKATYGGTMFVGTSSRRVATISVDLKALADVLDLVKLRNKLGNSKVKFIATANSLTDPHNWFVLQQTAVAPNATYPRGDSDDATKDLKFGAAAYELTPLDWQGTAVYERFRAKDYQAWNNRKLATKDTTMLLPVDPSRGNHFDRYIVAFNAGSVSNPVLLVQRADESPNKAELHEAIDLFSVTNLQNSSNPTYLDSKDHKPTPLEFQFSINMAKAVYDAGFERFTRGVEGDLQIKSANISSHRYDASSTIPLVGEIDDRHRDALSNGGHVTSHSFFTGKLITNQEWTNVAAIVGGGLTYYPFLVPTDVPTSYSALSDTMSVQAAIETYAPLKTMLVKTVDPITNAPVNPYITSQEDNAIKDETFRLHLTANLGKVQLIKLGPSNVTLGFSADAWWFNKETQANKSKNPSDLSVTLAIPAGAKSAFTIKYTTGATQSNLYAPQQGSLKIGFQQNF